MKIPSRRHHVTMQDVARACNVSISTVSLVLSHDKRIPARTKQKVLSVVKSFGYRPNVLARNLSKQLTMTLACLLPCDRFVFEAGFYNEVVKSVYESASERGFRLIFEMMTPQFIRRHFYTRLFREKAIDGMMILFPSLEEKFLYDLNEFKSSVVVLGSEIEGNPLYAIVQDDVEGGYLATEHLIRLGHRKVALLYGAQELPWENGRFLGYKKAMDKNNLQCDGNCAVRVDLKIEGSLSGPLRRFMDSGVTALFASSDLLALKTIDALKQMGCSVPGDVSVVGMGNISSAAYSSPPLTTVDISLKQMASNALKFLSMKKESVESLSKFFFRFEKSKMERKSFSELLPVTLVERKSCRKNS